MITDCLSGANILRDAVSATWKPHRVGFLRRFGLKTGIHFGHFGPESGMVFEGTTGGMYLFNSIPNEKEEREICQFEMDLKNFLLAL